MNERLFTDIGGAALYVGLWVNLNVEGQPVVDVMILLWPNVPLKYKRGYRRARPG
jgi:hypothetical protein